MMDDDYSSSSASESNISALDQIQTEEPKIKYKVPYCNELSEANIVAILTPHKRIIDQIQAFLLWRWPIQSVIFLLYFNAWAFITYLLDLSFINILIIILTTVVFLAIVHEKKNVLTSFIFPPIPVDKDLDQPNRIYSLPEIAVVISTIGSRLYCFMQSCFQKATDISFLGQLSWIAILSCMFVFFKIVRTFWICLFIINSILIVPGILFRPSIYPRIKDNLQWMMMVISPKEKDD